MPKLPVMAVHQKWPTGAEDGRLRKEETMELYELTMKEAAQSAIDTIVEELGVSKAHAAKLFKNAILYNCVIDEIVGQASFLLEKEGE